MIGRFEKLVFDIPDKNPDIQVFVSAILPRDVNLFPGAVNKLKVLDRCNESVKEVNAGLLSMKDVVAIEHPRFGSDRSSANRFLLSKDGLHLTTDGVLEMKRDIETAVRFRLKPMSRPAPRIYDLLVHHLCRLMCRQL